MQQLFMMQQMILLILGNEAITVSGSITVAQANTIDTYTSGVVTATISTQTIADLKTLTKTGQTNGNAYTITVSDTNVTAADLNTVNGATTLNVTATAVETITGSYTDINTLLTNEGGTGNKVNLDGDFNITVSSGFITVTQANALDALTTGVITASIDTDTSIDDLKLLTKTGQANGHSYTICIKESTAAATDLEEIDGKTTVAVAVDCGTVTTVTGTDVELVSLLKLLVL